MSEQNSKSSVSKYIIASIAALLIIGVAATTIMIKAKRREQPVIQPVQDMSDSENYNKSNTSTPAETKTIPQNETKATKTETASQTSISFPIDINKASVSMLCEIDGVGEYTANNIITYREKVGVISSLEQLLNVDGIGKKTLDRISKYLFVNDADKEKHANATISTMTNPDRTTSSRTGKTTKQTISDEKSTVSNQSATKQSVSTLLTEKELKDVNINTASAEEISNCLLISIDDAEKIVEMREKIHVYSSKEEVLLSKAFSQNYFLEIKEHILI